LNDRVVGHFSITNNYVTQSIDPLLKKTPKKKVKVEKSIIGILAVTLSWLFTDVKHVEKAKSQTV